MRLPAKIDEIFGRWTVTGEGEKRGAYYYVPVLCTCGTARSVERWRLESGGSKSCGCLTVDVAKAAAIHGMWRSRTYQAWADMKNRCLNPRNKRYGSYGGLGITVCSEWLKFENFLRDLGEAPEGQSLDRENNELGYCKENCRWVSSQVQGNNRGTNVFYLFDGQYLTMADLARRQNVNYSTLRSRLLKANAKRYSYPEVTQLRKQTNEQRKSNVDNT